MKMRVLSPSTTLIAVLLVMGAVLPAAAAPKPAPEVHYDAAKLPERVRKMRSEILAAARTGNIEAMRPVLESNELMPLVAHDTVADPIAHWKQTSADGEGREILAMLLNVLEAGYVKLNAGKPDETYVWPYFAELPLDKLAPAQQVELYRIVSPDEVKTMKELGAYIHYRLGIGRDGTWHYFIAGN